MRASRIPARPPRRGPATAGKPPAGGLWAPRPPPPPRPTSSTTTSRAAALPALHLPPPAPGRELCRGPRAVEPRRRPRPAAAGGRVPPRRRRHFGAAPARGGEEERTAPRRRARARPSARKAKDRSRRGSCGMAIHRRGQHIPAAEVSRRAGPRPDPEGCRLPVSSLRDPELLLEPALLSLSLQAGRG